MTRRGAQRWLWIAALLAAPLPVHAAVATGLMPVARMALLGSACVLVMLLETTQGAVGTLAGLLLGQALGWALVLWLAAFGLARALAVWLSPRALTVVTIGLVATWLAFAASVPIYRTPFRAEALHSTWLEVFE